jgi:hypothetical protein
MWNQPSNTVPIGYTILITDPLGAAIPAQPGFPLSGTYYPQGTGLVWTNLPWLDGPDGSGHFIRSGWMVAPGINAGSQYSVTPVARPTQGSFAGLTIDGGTKAIIWTGDSTADQDGWVLVDDAATVDWQLGTPNLRPQADTITGAISWGTVRHFDVAVPAGTANDDVRSLLTGFTQDTQLIRCEIRDSQANGSVYEFNIMISQGVQPLLSPIAAIANNPVLKEINIKRVGSNIYLLAKFKTQASSHTLHITLTSNDQHLDTIHPHWAGYTMPSNPSINAEKNYPDTEELVAELTAASASADIQVPQWFTRSSIVKNVNQTAFSLGVKPKRYLRAKFMAQGGGDTPSTWPQVIAQLNGSWISWQLHNRSDVLITETVSQRGPISEIKNSMAVDNSGLYTSEPIKTTSYPATVEVEIHFFNEHTLIETSSRYLQLDNIWAEYFVRVIYNESWKDQLNFIGYKNGNKTFSFIEAYIQWE